MEGRVSSLKESEDEEDDEDEDEDEDEERGGQNESWTKEGRKVC